MSFKLTVMYPDNEDTTFNMKYYLDHHMPLAERIWKPFGFLKWEVVEVDAGPDGSKSEHRIVNIMTWKDQASYAAGSAAKDVSEIWDDLPNVCNYKPAIFSGSVVASG